VGEAEHEARLRGGRQRRWGGGGCIEAAIFIVGQLRLHACAARLGSFHALRPVKSLHEAGQGGVLGVAGDMMGSIPRCGPALRLAQGRG